jgi:hypothetical protein
MIINFLKIFLGNFFTLGNVFKRGHYLNVGPAFNYHLIQTFYFGKCPHPQTLPHNEQVVINMITQSLCI